MSTAYHAKYFAHELSRIGGDGVERLGRSLFDANVDLNPHQIEAALFAMRSPLSKGVLLADEVGLGKNHRSWTGSLSALGRKKTKNTGPLPSVFTKAMGVGVDRKVQHSL